MEILNYDSGNESNGSFKQLYPFMPNNIFRTLLAGNFGSGKTNLLSHILMKPLVCYDQIHLYVKNLDLDKYQILIKDMDDVSKEAG